MTKSSLLNSVQFTDSAQSMCISLQNGFAVLTINPFKKIFHRFFENQQFGNSVTIIDSNIIICTGVAGQPGFLDTSLFIFDESIGRIVLEIACKESVRNIAMLPDMFAFSSKTEVRIYTFIPPVLYCQFRTGANEFAPLDFVETPQKSFVIAFSGRQPGTLRIVHQHNQSNNNYTTSSSNNYSNNDNNNFDYYYQRESPLKNQDISIPAHKSPLAYVKLNSSGTLVATASSLGTIIKVYNTRNGELVGQFRRGSLSAEIHSIAFSKESELLAVSSSKGTIHVFTISSTPSYITSDSSPIRADMKVSKPDIGGAALCFETKERLVAVSNQCTMTTFILSEIDKTMREDKSIKFVDLISIQ